MNCNGCQWVKFPLLVIVMGVIPHETIITFKVLHSLGSDYLSSPSGLSPIQFGPAGWAFMGPISQGMSAEGD